MCAVSQILIDPRGIPCSVSKDAFGHAHVASTARGPV
jgi:hypothetical protein